MHLLPSLKISIFIFISFLSCKNNLLAYDLQKVPTKKIKVAISPEFPPFDIIKDGKLKGIDPEILYAIEKISKMEFELITMPFPSVIAAVTSGRVDMAISGITVTEERKKSLSFSKSYHIAKIACLTRKGEDFNLHNSKKIAVQTGTTIADFADKAKSINTTLFKIDNNYVALEMLKNRKVDILLIEDLQAAQFAFANKELQYDIVTNSPTFEYAIAFKKHSKLKHQINHYLDQLEKNNQIKNIIKQATEEKTISVAWFKKGKWIVQGCFETIKYGLLALLFGSIIAIFLILLRYSGYFILKFLAESYISIIRGTPLLLQLSIVYFLLPLLISKFIVDLSIFTSAVIALSINSGAYIAEILRTGILSLDKGQIEAAKSLNLSNYQIAKDILMPQIVKNIIPALTNETVALIKETSIISVIGGEEIMKRVNIVTGETYSYFIPLFIAASAYYLLSFSIERLGKLIEKNIKWSNA